MLNMLRLCIGLFVSTTDNADAQYHTARVYAASVRIPKESRLCTCCMRSSNFAFAELLSCGLATIDSRAALFAIVLQLVDDMLFTLSRRRLSTAEV